MSKVPPATKEQKAQFQAARTEFREMSLAELKGYEDMFATYDTSQDGFITLAELKYMMEKLGMPQTHLGLKAMIKVVDEDSDEQMSYREFLLIFKYAKEGKLMNEGLRKIAASCDVQKEGVGGAKSFFEKKADDASSDVAKQDAEHRAKLKAEREKAAAGKQSLAAKAALFDQK